jgi:hypothetical protein
VKGLPPSAAQTGHADFPHPAFTEPSHPEGFKEGISEIRFTNFISP